MEVIKILLFFDRVIIKLRIRVRVGVRVRVRVTWRISGGSYPEVALSKGFVRP